MFPEGIEKLAHGKGIGITVLFQDVDFGRRIGSQRHIQFTLRAKEGYQPHFHSGMEEMFEVTKGNLSVWLLDQVAFEPIAEVTLTPVQNLLIKAKTPHVVFNDGDRPCIAYAYQRIVELGGETINL